MEKGKKMAKYIDRNQLIDWLKTEIKFKDLSDGLGLCLVMMKEDFECAIKHMPDSIIKDVAPVKHGHWIHTDYALHWTAKDECSECTYHARDRDDLSEYNYCPNCGAKMDEEKKENE